MGDRPPPAQRDGLGVLGQLGWRRRRRPSPCRGGGDDGGRRGAAFVGQRVCAVRDGPQLVAPLRPAGGRPGRVAAAAGRTTAPAGAVLGADWQLLLALICSRMSGGGGGGGGVGWRWLIDLRGGGRGRWGDGAERKWVVGAAGRRGAMGQGFRVPMGSRSWTAGRWLLGAAGR